MMQFERDFLVVKLDGGFGMISQARVRTLDVSINTLWIGYIEYFDSHLYAVASYEGYTANRFFKI